MPSGTVTFLFTDIEGSTNLARQFPAEWPAMQARHHAIMQQAMSAHNGHLVRSVGDEFVVAFDTAIEALQAALAAQHALNAVDWGTPEPLRVRMALHTGRAVLRGDEYEGYLTLSHTKRLMSVANGGQILISQATEALLPQPLPAGTALRDLGKHRLKDFDLAETIYQVVVADLPSDFPALKSIEAFPTNLPVQLTSFIGRDNEIAEVKQLLTKERLVTLTGPGGSGKTRLALQVAALMVEHFQDGVFFIALAPITDPGLIASTIAQPLGILETAGIPILESLKNYLSTRSILLLLDNFEQVIVAAPLVKELLAASSAVKILVTSREGLRISGEREVPVLPLTVPVPSQLPSVETLSQYAAVELFIQRAQAVKPNFNITNETAPAVAEICYRLDGLPLAIELAAARIKLLPPRAMLSRLEHRLEFLTGGARDLPRRQQTLRNTIQWSYDLLTENEQKLFRRISVFVGGCTISAVESVAEDQSGNSVIDQLGSLLDKSLLREFEGLYGEPRIVILETLREFGKEQLDASGEQALIRMRHAQFFLALAEQAKARIESAEQVEWLNRLEQDHDNLRAALEWSRTTPGAEEICVRLAAALGLFWEARGYITEGRERLSAVLAMNVAQGRTPMRGALLGRAAELAYRQSDYPATIRFASESLEICREVGDKQGTASALVKLGNAATEGGDYQTAPQHLEEALAIWRELGDKRGTSRALVSLSWAALRPGDYLLAKARLEEALSISRELGDTWYIGFELSGLGEVALRLGDFKQATRLLEESLQLRRQVGNKWGVGVSLGTLGWVAMCELDWDRAVTRLGESLAVRQEIGDKGGCAWCLERLAEIAMARGEPEKAVRTFGSAAALRASIGSVIDPVDQPEYESRLASLRAEVGEERFDSSWKEGMQVSMNQAVDYALER